jgi:hypothetical protein
MQITYPMYIKRLSSELFSNVILFVSKLVILLFLMLLFIYTLIYISSDLWLEYLFKVEIPHDLLMYTDLLLVNLSLTLIIVYSFVPIHPLYLALGYAKQTFYITLLGASLVVLFLYLSAKFIGIEYVPLAMLAGDSVIIAYKLKKLFYEWKNND